MKLRSAAAVIAVLVVCSILAAGCTGETKQSQPPPSTVTFPTRRPVTPVPVTTAPIQTLATTALPIPTTTPSGIPGSVVQEGTVLLIQGDVDGYRSSTYNYIDELRFTVVKVPRVDPVTLDIPETQIVFTKGGTQYAVNYLLVSGDVNNDRILDEGEVILVSIPLQPPNVIYPGQAFTMTIKTPPYQPVVVTANAPNVLTAEPMVLAEA